MNKAKLLLAIAPLMAMGLASCSNDGTASDQEIVDLAAQKALAVRADNNRPMTQGADQENVFEYSAADNAKFYIWHKVSVTGLTLKVNGEVKNYQTATCTVDWNITNESIFLTMAQDNEKNQYLYDPKFTTSEQKSVLTATVKYGSASKDVIYNVTLAAKSA